MLFRSLGNERRHLVDMLDISIAAGETFLQRRVAAGESAFVEMWMAMGGEARFERRRAWLAAKRDDILEALG